MLSCRRLAAYRNFPSAEIMSSDVKSVPRNPFGRLEMEQDQPERKEQDKTTYCSISSLPKGFRGTDFTSELMISADGKFLYAANRLHDSIAWFSIGLAGTLTFAGEEWTRGDYPRSFNIDPMGNFLYSCNQRADTIAVFRVNRQTGALTFTDQYTDVGTPAIIVFLT